MLLEVMMMKKWEHARILQGGCTEDEIGEEEQEQAQVHER